MIDTPLGVASRAVIDIPTRVASGVVTAFPHAMCQQSCLFPQHNRFLFEDSVSQWFDTRYFTFSPAKSSAELLLSLHQSLFSSAEQVLFSYSVVDLG